MMVWVVVSGFFLAANSNASEPVLRGLSQIPTAAVDVVGFKPLWMGFAMAGVALVAGSSLLARKMRLQKAADSVADATPAVAPTPAPKVHVKANGAKTVRFNLNPGGARNGTNGNGHANGHAKLNGANGKKRRIFNYEKFYTEMMLQGPAPAMAEPLARFRSRESVNGHNGHNGHAASALALNGAATNGHSNSGFHAASDAMMQAHVEIIAGQKSLIEDQKRIIQEQARLIDEKTRLLSEKSALLERQSQMIDHNLL